jgi:hypothetical protein
LGESPLTQGGSDRTVAKYLGNTSNQCLNVIGRSGERGIADDLWEARAI